MSAACKMGQYRDLAATGDDTVDIVGEFWRQWEEYQGPLSQLCLKMMKYNQTDAEDALSQACIKAWEKVQKYAGKIGNLKSWLF